MNKMMYKNDIQNDTQKGKMIPKMIPKNDDLLTIEKRLLVKNKILKIFIWHEWRKIWLI